MHTWILIMTLIYGGHGAAMATAEYGSAQECNQAGEVWKTTMKNANGGKNYYRPYFVCTKSTANTNKQ